MLTRTRSALAPALCAGLLVAALTGCGSDDKASGKATDKESGTPTPSATAAATASYLPVPDDVQLTPPGTVLDLGEHAVVAFTPRQDEVAALAITVRKIERTSFQESFAGWTVDDVTAARTPYFVRFSVVNVGDDELGGRTLTNVLWINDGSTLNAANFYTAQQQPLCGGGTLPAAFGTGSTVEMCAVYYLPPAQSFQSVTFQPPGGLDSVSWEGAVSPVTKPTPPKKKAGNKAKQSRTVAPQPPAQP